MNLRTPGPTPLPPEVREALAHDMVDHRGPEFAEAFRESMANLKDLFRTQNDVLILTGSGTGGLEASIANLFSPGERVLLASIGYFGERYGSIPLETDALGCDVVVSGSQKSWMIPPGLVFVALSPRAWEAHARSRLPRFYWDFSQARAWAEKGTTPWTPAVGLVLALRVALRL